MGKVRIYVLYHCDNSSEIAHRIASEDRDIFIPVRLNPHHLFESQFYLRLEPENWSLFEYVGTITYSFEQKLGVSALEAVRSAWEKHRGSDVIALNNDSSPRSIHIEGTAGHGEGFSEAWITLLTKMGYARADILSERHPVCYNNFWMARPGVLRMYCEFVRKAYAAVQSSQRISDIFGQDSLCSSRLSAEQLTVIFGKPYYALHPFVFERLACFFFSAHGFTIGLARGRQMSKDSMESSRLRSVASLVSEIIAILMSLVTGFLLVWTIRPK